MKHLLVSLLIGCTCFSVHAQSASENFSTCLSENTSGKDRKEMARWIFVGMGVHPDLQSISSISAYAPEETSKYMGQLFTRLITENCPKEAKAAFDVDGPLAFQNGFRLLGELAMRELMNNKEVAYRLSLWEKYVNKEKVQSTMKIK